MPSFMFLQLYSAPIFKMHIFLGMRQKQVHRKHVSIGDHEKTFILECYNHCHGKEWKEVLMFAKQQVIEAGLPGHVVHMYLDQSTDRLTQRMKNIERNAL